MPHRAKTARHLPPEEKKRHKKTKLTFYEVSDEFLPAAPEIFKDPEFGLLKKHPSVERFINDFWMWNEKVLWLLSSTSHPYIELQEKLARLASPYLGEIMVDLGCGTGNFLIRLFQLNGKPVRKIFALDIDWESLVQVPGNLRKSGYQGKVGLIHGSTMSELPIWSESVDCVVSSLGGLMYAGWTFEDGRLVSEGRRSLINCLRDINRILKPNGCLAFSAPKPNPNWGAVLRDSLRWLLVNRRFHDFFKSLGKGLMAKKLSAFMNKVESTGHAHYLSLEDWEKYLKLTGFEIISSSFGEVYAKQGIVVVAKKISSSVRRKKP